MGKKKKLADLYEAAGYDGATGRRLTREAQSDDDSDDRWGPIGFPRDMFIPGGPTTDPLFTGPRATKMDRDFPGVFPEELQQWHEVKKRGKMKDELQPIHGQTYMLNPQVGGEEGYEFPSGRQLSRLYIPREERYGPYTEDTSQWETDVIDPSSGEFHPDYDESEDIDAMEQEYRDRAGEFKGQLTEYSKMFNRRMKDWIDPDENKPSVINLLSQNYWTNFDRVIYGGEDDVLMGADEGRPFTFEELHGDGGRNLIAAIDHRLGRVSQIQSGVDAREAAAGDPVQEELINLQLDALASLTPELWHSNPEEYIETLSFLYGGDPMLMAINPLGVGMNEYDKRLLPAEPTPESSMKYSDEWQESIGEDPGLGYEYYPPEVANMFDAYLQTTRKNTRVPRNMEEWIENETTTAKKQGVDPKDMLRQKWPLIDVGADALHRATWMKKHITNPSHYHGLTSPKTDFQQGMPLAQMHEIKDYGDEINLLKALRERLVSMAQIKKSAGLENNSFQEVVQHAPMLIDDMNAAVDSVLRLGGQLYGGDRFVTKDDRMNPAYDIDQATKMEIFGKILFLAQSWKAFLAKFLPQFLGEDVSIDDLGMIKLDSAVRSGLTTFAAASDIAGDHRTADVADTMLRT